MKLKVYLKSQPILVENLVNLLEANQDTYMLQDKILYIYSNIDDYIEYIQINELPIKYELIID